jgi:putative ABC transport system permease protein
MTFADLLRLGLSNLWRTKLRSTLTTLGVTIGIGALIAMVSFGTGMQKNITDVFEENDLFTSLYVTPTEIDLQDAMSGNATGALESLQKAPKALNDAAIDTFRSLSGVDIVFAESRFPVKIRFRQKETTATVRALPAEMARYKPYSQIPYGAFFMCDSSSEVILSQRVLEDLNIVLKEEEKPARAEDDSAGTSVLPADSILGADIEVITSVLDVGAINKNPFGFAMSKDLPFNEAVSWMKIAGIGRKASAFENGPGEPGILMPIRTADRLPRLGFNNVWSLLSRRTEDGYASVYVRVASMKDLDRVQNRIEEMGYGVFSIADQLDQMKKGFLIMDTALGAIGTIALVVAALGIINTMIMSILERRREIGIMKAIGGSENEIKTIFFFEAGVIGFAGGICGLLLGWIATRIANMVANITLAEELGTRVDFFYIPYWLIIGAMLFSLLVSLAAGLYPAVRAARVDPVEALRHD